ncbi:MAG: 3-deoxy-D-manno-octulosonic acid kinase [Gammaproteobacteria bacterium]|nr:MAG: 3-deoxy-D-manno-octulosonic acid kinase [Gammaproteobacteria bacterium]
MNDAVEKTRNGAIVYDTDLINQISDAAFTARSWPSATPVTGVLRSAGRGDTMIVGNGEREFVLRHYVRGGLPGRLVRDKYLWTGEAQTRSFAEWRLLAKLVALGLPVPHPAAARYSRTGPVYSADLLTVRVAGIRSLAERIAQAPGDVEFWENLGADLHQFHAAGVFHADLNAYNVQVDRNDKLFLLDFDRGKILPSGVWQQKNISRLHRSMRKIKRLEPKLYYVAANWKQFLDGYFSASRSA